MTTYLVKENRVTSLGSVNSRNDLKRRLGDNINPPPPDGRCEVCGRSLEELKPYGKAGDPLMGDFNGELLVKRWRPRYYYEEKAQSITDEMLVRAPVGGEFEKGKKFLIERSGSKNKLEVKLYHFQGNKMVGSSWECRDCIVLEGGEYYEKVRKHGVGTDSSFGGPLSDSWPMEGFDEILSKGEKMN